MQIDAITIEEGAIREEEEVHVDGHQHGNEEQRRGPDELVDEIVRNDRERRRIEEDVVVLVLLPPKPVDVSQAVIGELVEIGSDPHHEEREDEIRDAATTEPRVRVRPAGVHEMERHGRAKRGREDAFQHLEHLAAHHRDLRELRVRFALPSLEGRAPVVEEEQRPRHEERHPEREPREREPRREEVPALSDFVEHRMAGGTVPRANARGLSRGCHWQSGWPPDDS